MNYILQVLLTIALELFLFAALFVLVMGIYRAHLAKRLRWYHYVSFGPWVVIGFLFDIASQYTIAVLIFTDFPRWKEWLVTDRLIRYVHNDYGYRTKIALFLCHDFLDIFDPSGNHCHDHSVSK